ncbi:MAG: hypothetical protein ABIU05_08040 [Nitrospirales bacterium]
MPKSKSYYSMEISQLDQDRRTIRYFRIDLKELCNASMFRCVVDPGHY